jgi:hypothetical protein
MPPVQQVPLSLKKEVDWSGGLEDKNTGESSSDFSRHPHDSVSIAIVSGWVGWGRWFFRARIRSCR